MADYSIELCTAESKWNAAPLFNAFYNGLSNCINDEVAAEKLPANLALVALAVHIDGHHHEHRRERPIV